MLREPCQDRIYPPVPLVQGDPVGVEQGGCGAELPMSLALLALSHARCGYPHPLMSA